MLATLARVAAVRRARLLFGPGGGRGLWTGRPQSGTLRDAVRAAKGTPTPVSPSGGAMGRAPALSRSVSCPQPTLRPLPPLAALARWPRGRPDPARRPPRGHPARRPGRGPRARPCAVVLGDASPLSLTPTLTRLPSLTHFEKVPPAAFQEGFRSAALQNWGGEAVVTKLGLYSLPCSC